MGEEIPFDVNVIGNREDYNFYICVKEKSKLSLIAKISILFLLLFFDENIPKISI